MKKMIAKIMLVLAAISLVGCSDMSKQDVGTMTGALAGGLLGSQFGGGGGKVLAVAGGAIAGAFIGNAIGKNMDETDRLKMNQAFESNSVGQPAYWRNQNTGASYTVVPVKNVAYQGNQYCREYRSTANIAGKEQQVYGTACRQPDGTWKIVK